MPPFCVLLFTSSDIFLIKYFTWLFCMLIMRIKNEMKQKLMSFIKVILLHLAFNMSLKFTNTRMEYSTECIFVFK